MQLIRVFEMVAVALDSGYDCFVCTFVEVENLSNGSRLKFELDPTFARLPYDFSFVLQKKVGSCRNRWNSSSNFVRFVPNISKFVE